MIKYNISEKGKAGRKLLEQVLQARQWAEMKRNRRFKRDKLDEEAYKPGVTYMKLSAVSESIKNAFGGNLPTRRERRAMAADSGLPFTAHYNGEGPVRTQHDIRPSKWARG